MASLESLVPDAVERHLRLNHARITEYAVMRREIVMLLEAEAGASIALLDDDPMDTSSLQKRSDKGKGKDKKGKRQ
eukprot:5424620-Amphidinium_carterae.1